MLRHKLATACGAAVLLLMATGPITHAQQGQNGQGQNGNQNGQGQNSPSPGATPELDSALLFVLGGGGGAISYLLLRRRARSRKTD